MQKRGPLNFLTLVRQGGLEKNTTNFPVKMESTCYANFHGQKQGGGGWKFLRSEGGGRKIFAINCFFIRPPYKCLWTVPESVYIMLYFKCFCEQNCEFCHIKSRGNWNVTTWRPVSIQKLFLILRTEPHFCCSNSIFISLAYIPRFCSRYKCTPYQGFY